MKSPSSAGKGLARHIVTALALAYVAAGLGAQSTPLTYTAEYEASYKGKRVGTSVFSVKPGDKAGTYIYESVTTAKGLVRLLSPRPVVERALFELVDGAVRPLEFWHEDGSRSGEDNQHILFDWEEGVAVTTGEFGTLELPIEPGTLDRGSAQVALMADAGRGSVSAHYTIAAEDSVSVYDYMPLGEKTVSTSLGELEAISYSQQREGSSRRMVIDFAPKLGYVPVKIEQWRGDEVLSSFTLTAIEQD